jgi:hypothetical protein
MEEMRSACKILVGKPEGERPLTIPRHCCKDHIKMDLTETKLEGVDWIHMAQNSNWWQALVNTVFNLGLQVKWKL